MSYRQLVLSRGRLGLECRVCQFSPGLDSLKWVWLPCNQWSHGYCGEMAARILCRNDESENWLYGKSYPIAYLIKLSFLSLYVCFVSCIFIIIWSMDQKFKNNSPKKGRRLKVMTSQFIKRKVFPTNEVCWSLETSICGVNIINKLNIISNKKWKHTYHFRNQIEY